MWNWIPGAQSFLNQSKILREEQFTDLFSPRFPHCPVTPSLLLFVIDQDISLDPGVLPLCGNIPYLQRYSTGLANTETVSDTWKFVMVM